jgi:hypothetical protein
MLYYADGLCRIMRYPKNKKIANDEKYSLAAHVGIEVFFFLQAANWSCEKEQND